VRTVALLIFAAVATGCAAGNRNEKTLSYTDHKLFGIEQHDSARGGHVVGTVCAIDVQLDEQLRPDGVDLVGSAKAGATLPMVLAVREQGGPDARDIVGSIGNVAINRSDDDAPDPTINLQLRRDTIHGQVGSRHVDLRLRGNDYVGEAEVGESRMPYAVRGAEALWRLPAAAQASILPLLLTCTEPTRAIQIVDLRQMEVPPPLLPQQQDHFWRAPRLMTARPPRQCPS
jgi:hypothetical protein